MHSSTLHNHLVYAWKLTSSAQKIRRFNFFWSLLDTLILSWTLIYQVGYVWLDVMHRKSDFFSWARSFTTDMLWEHWTTFIGSLIFLGTGYFLVNFLIKNVFNAGLIYLIRAYNNRNEREYHTMPAFAFWWKKSIKLAEYHSLLFWSKPVYIFYIFFYWYRLLDKNWTLTFTIAAIFLIALILTRFLFEYARYFIIAQDKWVFESLGLSLTMTIENIHITLRIFFSLILVYIREIVLIVGIFTLPFVMSWLVALWLGPLFLQWVLILIGLVYFIFLIIVSAMNSVIEVFVESLWFSVFTENGEHASSHHHAPAHHPTSHH